MQVTSEVNERLKRKDLRNSEISAKSQHVIELLLSAYSPSRVNE